MHRSLSVIYATSTGHTDTVVDVLIAELAKALPDLRVTKQRAEVTKPEELTKSTVLVLACGSWNTGNVEGQLNPHMFELLNGRGAGIDLKGQYCAAIGLGDARYFYTARAAEKLTEFIAGHGGALLIPTLKIVNDPYGQEEKIAAWSQALAENIKKIPSAPNL